MKNLGAGTIFHLNTWKSANLQKFNRTWEEYKQGFGIPNDGWRGNEALHRITVGKQCILFIVLANSLTGASNVYSFIQGFNVASEADNYKVYVGDLYEGPYDNAFPNEMSLIEPDLNVHGMAFSTYDRDNDQDPTRNCAADYAGGWWFNACANAVLNAPIWKAGKGNNSTLWSFWGNVSYTETFLAVHCDE